MIADQKVREQVLDVSQSFLVQAPAGSGKTSLLVQRFLNLLAHAQQAPEEILALTFTRKAAAEMRSRIVNALQLGLGPEPQSEYFKKIWQLARKVLERDRQAAWDLIANPARLKIQTIDALCSSITKQMPIISQFGASPQIETKAEILYQKAVDQLLQATNQDHPWQAELNLLLLHLDNDLVKVKKLLVDMLAAREYWLPIIINNLAQQDIRQILEDSLADTIEEALNNLIAYIPEDLDFDLLPELDLLDQFDAVVLAEILLTKEGQWRRKVTEKQGFPAPSNVKNKEEKAQLKANKDRMEQILELLQHHETFRQQLITITKLPPASYSAAQWQILDALAIVLRVLVAKLTIVFKDSGSVDFAQVSIAAQQALGFGDQPTDLALALDCKIRHLLVDEFQDTSISQFALLEKITANWEDHEGKTLFLVGDPMQSIYRFRQAEVGLFLQTQQQGLNKIKLQFVCLTVNFRSKSSIVAWNNRVFTHSFPDLDDITYGAIRYMPAQAAKDEPAYQAVELLDLELQAQNQKIIQIIQETKAQDPDKTIAVLVRAKSHVLELLPVLRAAEIAFHGVELETLKQRSLIQDLLALTKALLHFDDRIAWLAILRAPWCGLSLADLHVLGKQEMSLWQALAEPEISAKLSTEGLIRTKRLVQVIDSFIKQRGRQSLDLQVQLIWEEFGAKHYVQDSNAQQEATAYFNLLAELASRREIYKPGFLEQQVSDLFLESLKQDSNPVQIMTMHKAKGLEFDIVILPSLGKALKRDKHKLLVIDQRHNPQAHLLMAPIKAADEEAEPIYRYLAWSEQLRQEYEELRLLYVAATRAKEKLFCIADLKQNAPKTNSPIAKIWNHIANEIKQADIAINAPATITQRSISRLPASWYKTNPYIVKQYITNDKRPDPWQQAWLRIVGIVVHKIFYRLATDGLASWPQHKIFSQQPLWLHYLRQNGLPVNYTAQALDIIEQAVRNTITDPIGIKILSSDYAESYAEWPLTSSSGTDFKQVILDRAFVDHSGVFWIVDYKILHDASELQQAIELYRPQLFNYTTTLKKLRAGAKIKAGLYFPLQQQWCEL
jgi:ATP-dependent helicase/nuclease subunit A